MKFEHYQMLKEHALAACADQGLSLPPSRQINPIMLAYIGDVVFSMYVRMRLLLVSQQVRVVNDICNKMVSAVCQAQAMEAIETTLTEDEIYIFHRGRNAKSMVPKSASVQQYRMATAFEALLGYLYLEEKQERLEEILNFSFKVIQENLQADRAKR